MSLIVAAPCSGSGKTLVSLCLVAALRERQRSVQAFKVGPDYLDTQLLTALSGRACRNLDPLLCGDQWLEAAFRYWEPGVDSCLVEGVMGLYDGLGPSDEGSTAHVARRLQLPVLFVVDAARQGHSVRALVAGFRAQSPDLRWCGVVLNGVGSERHRALLTASLADLHVPVLGSLPRCSAMALPSRHLGLLSPADVASFEARAAPLAHLAEQHLDLPRLLPQLQANRGSPGPNPFVAVGGASRAPAAGGPLVAIAHDRAFSFLYPEQEEWLRHFGARTQHWSPLADAPLPAGTAAVVLPGGYPELHARQLSEAGASLAALRNAHRRGLPIYAECGGMMLLLEGIGDPDGKLWPMAAILAGTTHRGALQLGYREAVACCSSVVVREGERWVGHEFHRWHRYPEPAAAGTGTAALWRLRGWGIPERSEGDGNASLHASWLHLHWSRHPAVPRRLVAAAAGG